MGRNIIGRINTVMDSQKYHWMSKKLGTKASKIIDMIRYTLKISVRHKCMV